jgi:hypothetical protein
MDPKGPGSELQESRGAAPLLLFSALALAGATPILAPGVASAMRGGDTGRAVIPGDPEASLLLAKVERRHRPPRRKLPDWAVTRLRAWIAAGATP